jgi:hypothetical protein
LVGLSPWNWLRCDQVCLRESALQGGETLKLHPISSPDAALGDDSARSASRTTWIYVNSMEQLIHRRRCPNGLAVNNFAEIPRNKLVLKGFFRA